MKVIVCIPCYNCAPQIPRVLDGFSSELLSRLEKVVLIDNRSKDDTPRVILEKLKVLGNPKFELIQNDQNYGLGGTHKVAFQYARKAGADYIAILHGDDQADTRELGILIEEAQAHPEATAILGSRFMRDSKLQGYSKLRTYGNKGLNVVYTALSGRMTHDLGSGLNLFKVSGLKEDDYLLFSDGFTFNMDLLLNFYRRRQTVRFKPITWSEADQVSNAKTFKVGWIALKTLLNWRFSINPEHTVAGSYSFKHLYPN